MSKEEERNAIGKISSLTKADLVVGILVGVLSVGSFIGSWFVIPYRVSQLEANQAELRVKVDAQGNENIRNRELLILLNERVRTIQRALKIPTEKEERE